MWVRGNVFNFLFLLASLWRAACNINATISQRYLPIGGGHGQAWKGANAWGGTFLLPQRGARVERAWSGGRASKLDLAALKLRASLAVQAKEQATWLWAVAPLSAFYLAAGLTARVGTQPPRWVHHPLALPVSTSYSGSLFSLPPQVNWGEKEGEEGDKEATSYVKE